VTIDALACRAGDPTLYRPGSEELPALLEDEDVYLWVDIAASGPNEEHLLKEVLGLHPLLVEDVLQESLPKIESHDGMVYLIVHGIDPDRRSARDLGTTEMDLLVGKRLLLTHHERPLRSIEDVRRRVEADPSLISEGPWFMAHAVLDQLTDYFSPLMDDFDKSIDRLELQVMRGRESDILERIFELKHSLQRIRRLGIHQKDILQRLARGAYPTVPEERLPFFRDVYEHFVQVSDLADSYRELVSAALDAYLGVQSHRMNEVIKVLTLISTIMLPLSFVAGLYGMNFEQMPELGWKYGYAYAWGVMLIIAISLLVFFRRKKWL